MFMTWLLFYNVDLAIQATTVKVISCQINFCQAQLLNVSVVSFVNFVQVE